MKKQLLLLITCVLLLLGCGTKSNSVANPYEIKIGDKTLSLYDSSKEDFEDNGFEVFEYLEIENNSNSITYRPNNNNCVSGINIYSDDIVTYKSISVGDDIEKLKKSFDKLNNGQDIGLHVCTIYLNSKGEEKSSSDLNDEDDGSVCIGYSLDDDYTTITQIHISDIKLAKSGT